MSVRIRVRLPGGPPITEQRSKHMRPAGDARSEL